MNNNKNMVVLSQGTIRLLIITFGLLVVLFMYKSGCVGSKTKDVSVKTAIPVDTLHWKNKDGDNVTSLKGNEESFAVITKRVADSVAKTYEVRLKDMREYLIAWTQSQADVPADTATRQTDYIPSPVKDCPPIVKNMRQQFNSAYDSISVQIGDSSWLHKRSFDTLTAVWKTVKQGFLFNRKKYLQLDLSFADTSRHVTGLTAYRAPQQKQKKWGIGFSSGVTYYNGRGRLYAGAGINYTFIRF